MTQLVGRQIAACARCSSADWMEHQAAERFTSDASAPGSPDYVFAFHEGIEIGPRMLARIAKHTGLKPEDL